MVSVSLLSWDRGELERLAGEVEDRVFIWWVEEGSPLPLYVGFSGGKDSSAVLAASVAAVGRDSVVAWFWHIPGQTHGDNVAVAWGVAARLGLRVVSIRVGDPRELASVEPEGGTLYHVVVGGRPYWEYLAERGAPAPPPRPRWCCKLFKEEPLSYTRPQRAGRRYVLTGVKRSDSRARRKRWSKGCSRTFKSRRGVVDYTLAPLCDLRDPQVWALLAYYGIDSLVKRQYEKWGRSPNCVLCPLASRMQLERAVKQLPSGFLKRYYEALRGHSGTLSSRLLRIIEEELVVRGELHG